MGERERGFEREIEKGKRDLRRGSGRREEHEEAIDAGYAVGVIGRLCERLVFIIACR